MNFLNHSTSTQAICAIVAHPDDEILGCAGTLMYYKKLGHPVHILILGEGSTSREVERNSENLNECEELKKNAFKALQTMGLDSVDFGDFYDNRFDHHDLLDIVKRVEEFIQQYKPWIVFTHFANDLNIDHKICNQAVLTATRPLVGQSVKEVYAFETLSATEWQFPLSFQPDTFVNISDFLELKCQAMLAYSNEIRDFPHPRSLQGIRLNAEYWGMRVGYPFVEAFSTLRRLIS